MMRLPDTTRRAPKSSLLRRLQHSSFLFTVLLLGLVTICAPLPAHGQDTTRQANTYRIKTNDGNVVLGTLVSETETEVVLNNSQFGKVTIQRTDIRKMKQIKPDAMRDGEYWFRNPQSTRYFIAPNAIGIPKNQGYYQNAWIFFNNFNYGISNHVSVGAGTVPTFLFGVPSVPFWFLPKVTIPTPTENLHFAGGAVIGGVLGGDGYLRSSLLYGSATVGNRDHNATIGLGYGYTNDGLSSRPAINVSGMTRVSKTIYLISENYFIPGIEGAGLISAGVRWAPESFAVDFALFRPLAIEGTTFIGLPWLGLTIPFGQ